MKKRILIVITFQMMTYVLARGQTVSPQLISSAGDTFKNSTYQLSWSIGEFQTETFAQGNLMLTQGFHQGSYSSPTVITNPDFNVDIIAYPNPAVDFIFLKIESELPSNLRYQFVDLSGRLLFENQFYDQCTKIDLSGVAPGVYLLKIQSGANIISVIKVKITK